MTGQIAGYSSYDYNQERSRANLNSKAAREYREKYLELRKILREYSKQTGHQFPTDITKAIGLK